MSYSYVLPGEQSSSGAAKRWLLAYVIAQLICFGAISAAKAVAGEMAWAPNSYEVMALTVAVAGIHGLTFGYLRSNILRHRLAAFRMLHFCAGIVIVGFFFSMPLPETISGLLQTAGNPQAGARLLMPVALTGLGYGLVVGAAEAFMMRRAAFGLLSWIAISALAWAGGLVAATIAVTYAASWSLTTIETVLIAIACTALQGLVTGVLMLPALRMLTPRLSYYGPRVYRPLLQPRQDRSATAP